eukprot:TRINITY_DN10125_c0_g1_i1.p1 TRINITY_DN10125_c0_g1~~TRINITY_DN10125_c0_g1_i1.p1  ORF type:complete len:321 (-),score=99.21 TRINITY_DN10125_c0_g1_i1:70-1032(-)
MTSQINSPCFKFSRGEEMQHDELIWEVIGNKRFCSFKVTAPVATSKNQKFCRNKYNVSGLCNRLACPLSNARYATVLEEEGDAYLYIKTAERSHSPKNLWERIKLAESYGQALKQIDQHLMFWPKFNVHKVKQRLTRIHQYLIRMRKLAVKTQPKLVGKFKKLERREKNREAKALKAAKLTESIKNELLERLHQGTYGDIYNFPQQQYDEILDVEEAKQQEQEVEGESEFVEAYDSDIMSDGMGDLEDALPLDSDDDDDDNDEDDDDDGADDDALLRAARKKLESALKQRKAGKRGPGGARKPQVEIEYEFEQEQTHQSQ